MDWVLVIKDSGEQFTARDRWADETATIVVVTDNMGPKQSALSITNCAFNSSGACGRLIGPD